VDHFLAGVGDIAREDAEVEADALVDLIDEVFAESVYDPLMGKS
jgi:hypothetical protein